MLLQGILETLQALDKDTLRTIVGFTAGSISLSAFVPYIVSIFKKETRPSRVSWLSFLATDILLLVSYFDSGAGTTLWMAAFLTCGAFVVSLLSIRYGTGGATAFDITCLALVAVTVGTIIYRYEPDVVLALSAFAMVVGAMPTFKKILSDPSSENILSWVTFGIGSAINVAAIDDWVRWQIVLHPAVIAAINVPIVAVLVYSRMKTARVCARGR